MTPDPVTITQDSNLNLVIKTMNSNQISHLPVVDMTNNLLGIISKSDLYKRALFLSQETSGKSYSQKVLFVTKASEVMNDKPVVVAPDQSIEFAIEILLQGLFHAIPVVQDGKLVGIMTSKDILEFVVATNDQAIDK